jgi:light-regulated signal transduction histidine kinase (bacteriophytochrome)
MVETLLMDLVQNHDPPAATGAAANNDAQRQRALAILSRLNADLERRVGERTRALSESNKALAAENRELEDFSLAVAHDLRSPLRTIDGFGRMLAEDPAGRLDQEQHGYLRRILSACGHMDSLISAILTLFRLSRQEMQFEPVDLAALARQTAGELQTHEPKRHVEFVIPDSLMVAGDPCLLNAVIENLFSNAWKFTRPRSWATIALGVLRSDAETVCFVRDNGVGFSTSRSDLLFAPFGRLHSEKEFDGIGLGLATVQRIIQRHGGRVWARGTVGQEATFYFSLPVRGGDHVRENDSAR